MVGYLAAPATPKCSSRQGFLTGAVVARDPPWELLAAMPDELGGGSRPGGNRDRDCESAGAISAAGADEICSVPATAGDPAGRAHAGGDGCGYRQAADMVC